MSKSLGLYFEKLRKLMGRKGLILLLVSMFLMYLGYQMVGAQPSPGTAANLVVPLTILPLTVWGTILTIAGAIGSIGVFWKPLRKLGHNVVSAAYSLWTGFYLVSWFTDLVTVGHTTYGAGTNVLLYGAILALLTIIAGWSENR